MDKKCLQDIVLVGFNKQNVNNLCKQCILSDVVVTDLPEFGGIPHSLRMQCAIRILASGTACGANANNGTLVTSSWNQASLRSIVVPELWVCAVPGVRS